MERLYRSATQRMIAGVCGGLGEYFDIDPTLVRIVYVLVTIATGVFIGVALYILLWLIVPAEASVGKSVRESMRENVDEMAQSARELGDGLRNSRTAGGRRLESAELAGLIILLIGIFILLINFNFFGWFHWGRLWPLVLIFIGLLLLFRQRNRTHP
jgi:phage shock protein C